MSKKPTITRLERELREAADEYARAANATSFAQSRECVALNALNRAQAALDEAVAELKKNAPRDSDWSRRRFLGADATAPG